MTAFALTKHPAMVLEAGVSAASGQHVSDMSGPGSRVLLVVDPAIKELGLADGIVASVQEAGHTIEVFDDLQSDPKESSVDAATTIAFNMDANCILGLGGGSALDTSKVVATLAHTGEACSPYRLAEKQLPFRKTCLISIPTTAGTGSETTGTSIISEPNGTKNWFWGPPLKPDMALMDPELTVGLPAYWTFYTGLDAIVHAAESRTNRYRYAENDGIAEKAITLGFENLVKAVKEPDNIAARTGMMQAAAFAGLAIGNTGCAVAHNVGHALGSIASIPHGRAVSVALAATTPWAVEGNRPAFERFAELTGCKSVDQLPDMLHGLAAECGFDLVLDGAERAKVSSEVLAKEMVDKANIAMLDATARDASKADVEHLATLVAQG